MYNYYIGRKQFIAYSPSCVNIKNLYYTIFALFINSRHPLQKKLRQSKALYIIHQRRFLLAKNDLLNVKTNLKKSIHGILTSQMHVISSNFLNSFWYDVSCFSYLHMLHTFVLRMNVATCDNMLISNFDIAGVAYHNMWF